MVEPSRALNHLNVRGKVVGLHGLEHALASVLSAHRQKELSADAAASMLLEAISIKNYVPEQARNAYLDALKILWARETGETGVADSDERGVSGALIIRILGAGCISCRNIERMILEVAAKKELAVDIQHVTDPDAIAIYGVLNTPAVVINERLVSAGKYPTPVQVEIWLDEAL